MAALAALGAAMFAGRGLLDEQDAEESVFSTLLGWRRLNLAC